MKRGAKTPFITPLAILQHMDDVRPTSGSQLAEMHYADPLNLNRIMPA